MSTDERAGASGDHPTHHARTRPDHPAIIMAGSGEIVTYRRLEERSNRGAQLFRALGLEPGDVVASLLDNRPLCYELFWATQRAGLYLTAISNKLTPEEVAYIIADSGAKVLIVAPALDAVADALASLVEGVRLFRSDGARGAYESYADAIARMSPTPIADESAGATMLYSSGTTGRPKGVKPALTGGPIEEHTPVSRLIGSYYGADEDTVYLSPAPLYHSAPLRWGGAIHRYGGTVVALESFDAERALAAIERYRCTMAQFVPTHFIRILKLPPERRLAYDLSSLKTVVHAAAPCPIPVKEQMIDWLGPIILEYYAGTEANGYCVINSQEWLAHKGSVGRAIIGKVRICDDDGEPLPPRMEGVIYFEGGPRLTYHNDPEKTAAAYNKYGWSMLGDVGWLDEEDYLYLTDRKSFMIISGGVNIYPQEIENLLVTHPKVLDVAVIGAPDDEMGEKVVAVVQPVSWADAGPALADELREFARAHLSHVKTPRAIDFMAELPRHATGKLYKRLIRDRYWGNRTSRIV